MATLDPSRAAFVKQEYRYAVKTDTSVKSRNDAARLVSVDTNLDETAANALASKYLAENIKPRVFEVRLQGVIALEGFVGGPPRYIPNFPRLATDGRTMKVISASIDYDAGITVVKVRG